MLITVGAVFARLGWSIGQFVLLVSLAQLAHIATWAIRNQITATEADRRLRVKEAKHERDMAQRTAVAAALMESVPKAKPTGPAKSHLDQSMSRWPRRARSW